MTEVIQYKFWISRMQKSYINKMVVHKQLDLRTELRYNLLLTRPKEIYEILKWFFDILFIKSLVAFNA